ncbi:NUDIX hydrolase [Candidatus Saccharibacteria bacterium]|nr:NUDIX hydrolase [Candidatus Saccharibacteria bacterium]
MTSYAHGVIDHPESNRKTDYLYRISIKGVILNDVGDILLVKESGRNWWDLPGGGMDHGEDIKTALAREMKEEVNLTGDFSYKVVHVDDPTELKDAKVLQVRLIFIIKPEIMEFSPGNDSDEIAFIPLEQIKEVDMSKYEYLKMVMGSFQSNT